MFAPQFWQIREANRESSLTVKRQPQEQRIRSTKITPFPVRAYHAGAGEVKEKKGGKRDAL